MSALLACIKKDVRLFFSSWTGIASLLLPLLLLLAMAAGLGGTVGARSFVRPFAIAVRDEDETVMSRMLIDQIRRVDVIEEVRRAGEGETDESLLADGAAAIITIPQDFFYALYGMEDCPVTVCLNGEMPVEAAVMKNLVSSVMGIISANQSAYLTLYELEHGEMDEAQRNALYAETANAILSDALSRHAVFDAYELAADEADAKITYYAAAVAAITLLFIPLSVVKGVPEELHLGVLPRFRAMGGNVAALFFSRFLSSLLLSSFPVAAILLLTRMKITVPLLLTLLLTLLAGFSLFLLLGLVTDNVPRAQMLGNVIIVSSLLLGGALYPTELLPDLAAYAGYLTIPYYTLRGFTASFSGQTVLETLLAVWPLAAFGVASLALDAWIYRERGRRGCGFSV